MKQRLYRGIKENLPTSVFATVLLVVVLCFVIYQERQERERAERYERARDFVFSQERMPDEEGNYRLSESYLELKDRWEEYGIGYLVLKSGYSAWGEGYTCPIQDFLSQNNLEYRFDERGFLEKLYDELPVYQIINDIVMECVAERCQYIDKEDGYYILKNEQARLCAYMVYGSALHERKDELIFRDGSDRVIENDDLLYGSLLDVDAVMFHLSLMDIEKSIRVAGNRQLIPLVSDYDSISELLFRAQ